jgi:hypothetical protein
MHRKEQDEFILVQLQQNSPQQRSKGKIKGLLSFLIDNPASLSLALALRPLAQID